jgi:hypothetical protein
MYLDFIMGFFCPVCNNEWLIYNNLCQDCRKIKHTMSLVGKERFMIAIDRLFVMSDKKTCKLLEKEENEVIGKIVTRSQSKDKS